ncbi:hypothetical protein QFC21_003624 [Naganishia friedmannii]|uniref:Uncharacterized protein n=1 Tax=Naganishia friedmannii TaxID=89922 RepID=A0ACC2VNC6_9TREE|nr:hypothetical protein QFC21_003624 [Naganishia friedmannii]
MATVTETGVRLSRPHSMAFASARTSSSIFAPRAVPFVSRSVFSPAITGAQRPVSRSFGSHTLSAVSERSRLRTRTSQIAATSTLNIRALRAFATSATPTTTTFTSPTSTPHEDSNNSEPDPSPPSPGLTGKLKDLMKKYGRHALAVYLLLSGVDLAITFTLVHLAGAEKIEWVRDYVVASWRDMRYGSEVAKEMQRVEEEEQRVKDLAEQAEQGTQPQQQGKKKKNANAMLWAEFALAYGIHKTLLLPVRVGATAAVTPKLVHWLTARGWVGKGGVKRAATHASGKVKQASAQAQDRVKEASDRVKDLAKRTKE